jgi:hypothetical protein
MIWQSEFWKDDLLRRAKCLRQKIQQRRWPDAAFGRLEQLLMVGFYSIRKLAEAKVLSDSTVGTPITLRLFPPRGKRVTRMNWHRIEELYRLDAGSRAHSNLVELCHQFVHSYVFVPSFNEKGKLEGVFFASDRARNAGLRHLQIAPIARLFERAGSDYPNEVRMTFDARAGDYVVRARLRT